MSFPVPPGFGYGAGQPITGRLARAAAGIPTEEGDKIAVFARSRLATAPIIRATLWVYNPRTDLSKAHTFQFQLTGTAFAQESDVDESPIPPGCIIVAATITGGSTTDPGAQWAGLLLFRGGDAFNSIMLCRGFITNDHPVSWPVGVSEGPAADVARQGAIFTFLGEVTNGAGGAGNQSLTVTPAAGSRFRVVWARMTNGDTATRAAFMRLTDGSNELVTPQFSTALGIGTPMIYGMTNVGSATFVPVFVGDVGAWVCGSQTWVMEVDAVAASENSLYALVLEVYGPAPTFTLAGASTPTLTTTTSRFEAG